MLESRFQRRIRRLAAGALDLRRIGMTANKAKHFYANRPKMSKLFYRIIDGEMGDVLFLQQTIKPIRQNLRY